MKAIFHRYKIPLLLALVVGLFLVVFGGVTYWLTAVWVFVGVLLGMVLPDLEYILHAYVVDTQSEDSLKLKEIIHERGIFRYFSYLNEHEHEFGELSIHSTIFQVLFAIFTFYVVIGGVWVLGPALALSMSARMLYDQVMELQQTGTLKRWFWIYKGELTKQGYYIYWVVMVAVFLFTLTFV